MRCPDAVIESLPRISPVTNPLRRRACGGRVPSVESKRYKSVNVWIWITGTLEACAAFSPVHVICACACGAGPVRNSGEDHELMGTR
jgi:hypothetical protein